MSQTADAVEKVFFVPSGLHFKSRWRANKKVIWWESSSGGELAGDFRGRAEGPSNGDRRLFCPFGGNAATLVTPTIRFPVPKLSHDQGRAMSG
jgi:hypothetical protein